MKSKSKEFENSRLFDIRERGFTAIGHIRQAFCHTDVPFSTEFAVMPPSPAGCVDGGLRADATPPFTGGRDMVRQPSPDAIAGLAQR